LSPQVQGTSKTRNAELHASAPGRPSTAAPNRRLRLITKARLASLEIHPAHRVISRQRSQPSAHMYRSNVRRLKGKGVRRTRVWNVTAAKPAVSKRDGERDFVGTTRRVMELFPMEHPSAMQALQAAVSSRVVAQQPRAACKDGDAVRATAIKAFETCKTVTTVTGLPGASGSRSSQVKTRS
jgi:hypothetical protein